MALEMYGESWKTDNYSFQDALLALRNLIEMLEARHVHNADEFKFSSSLL